MIHKDYVPLFPTIFALRNARIHVCSLDNHNVAFYVETSVDKIFSLSTVLRVLYANPNDCYVRFWRSFDNIRMEHKNNVIENVGCLKNSFIDV